MWLEVPIYCIRGHIMLQFEPGPPDRYTEVAAIVGIDPDGRLLDVELILGSGDDVELILGSGDNVAITRIVGQFAGCDNISINDGGYTCVDLRKPGESILRSGGYTLTLELGLNQELISLISIPWTHPKLGDVRNALSGLAYRTGEPIWA